jgi:hypothetical protein
VKSQRSELPDKVSIACACGHVIELVIIGGQYQNTYEGICPYCERHWELTCLNAEEL